MLVLDVPDSVFSNSLLIQIRGKKRKKLGFINDLWYNTLRTLEYKIPLYQAALAGIIIFILTVSALKTNWEIVNPTYSTEQLIKGGDTFYLKGLINQGYSIGVDSFNSGIKPDTILTKFITTVR